MKLILIGISILLMVIIYKLCEISNQLFSYYVSIKDYLYSTGCFISSEGEPIPIIHKIATIEMIRDWLPTIIEADREAEE